MKAWFWRNYWWMFQVWTSALMCVFLWWGYTAESRVSAVWQSMWAGWMLHLLFNHFSKGHHIHVANKLSQKEKP